MPGKRKRLRKAARINRRIPPNSRQKRGSAFEHDQGDDRRAERSWTTVPFSPCAHEAAKRAEQERLQRAEEKARRRAEVNAFIEEQRRTGEWMNFDDIADWFARRDNVVVPNETARAGAYELLRNDLLAGEFEQDGKSQVRFRHPNHETEWISRRRTVDLDEKKKTVSLSDAMDIFTPKDVITQYLAQCWIPRRVFQRWLTKHDLPMPARFEPEKQSAAASDSRTSGQSVAPRRRGRPPVKMDRTKEAMRNDICGARLTPDQLCDILEKELAEKYGVGRTTARNARNAVLSKFVGN